MSLVMEASRETKAAQIEELVRAVYTAGPGKVSEDGSRGELIVIGSGLSRIDFTQDSEQEIRSADFVFYCIYDNLTQLWLTSLRPDAIDLTVFYSATSDRYHTYMQMAELILYHVRRGKRVLAIYYGHPGVFATPAHRAVHIARREGHRAQMRPGISALDYLIADLGFDPAIPGMTSFEATDMLLRKRRIDPSLHMILWQVGVVGEFGFSPDGFKNHGFDILVEELERIYGPDWPVVNYIASRFPTVDAHIATHSVAELRRPEARRNVRSLSTFYIAPQQALPTDPERSVRLGLSKEGEPVQPPVTVHDNNRYGAHEVDAIRRLATFSVSGGFAVPRASPVSSFLLALLEDGDLRRRFAEDPDAVFGEESFADLTERARGLLKIPHALAVETALREALEGETSPAIPIAAE